MSESPMCATTLSEADKAWLSAETRVFLSAKPRHANRSGHHEIVIRLLRHHQRVRRLRNLAVFTVGSSAAVCVAWLLVVIAPM